MRIAAAFFILLVSAAALLYQPLSILGAITVYARGHGAATVVTDIHSYMDAVKKAAVEKNVDLGRVENRYRYLYGGVAVSLRVRDIGGSALAGYRPDEVVAAAYYDGGWHVLPTRVYRRIIETPHATYYIYPERITVNDTVEVRLPPVMPREAPPREKPCAGMRGAKGWVRLGLSLGGGLRIPIYIILKPEHRSKAVYAYSVASRKSVDEWVSSLPLPGLSLAVDAGIVAHPGDAARNTLAHPLRLGKENVTVEFYCPPNDPTCSIPDGGGGGHLVDYYEIWPSITSLEEPVIRLRPSNPVAETYVKLVLDNGLWRLVDVVLEGVVFRITAYMKDGPPTTLSVYINGSLAGETTVYPGELTVSYIEYWFPKAPLAGDDLRKPLRITLEAPGAGSDISVHAELIPCYLLGSEDSIERIMEKVATSTYTLHVPEAGDRIGSYTIVLHRNTGYKYAFEALYPAPKAGLLPPSHMLGDEAYITVLELVQRSATGNDYKARVCVANMFCQEAELNPGATDSITIVWDERLLGAIRDLWAANGYVPIVFAIEPTRNRTDKDTDILVLDIYTYDAKLELTTIPLYHTEFSRGDVNITEWTSLVDKTVLSTYMDYVWYSEAYLPVYRVVNNRYPEINTFIASPIRVAAATDNLPSLNPNNLNLRVEAKPFAAILMYSEYDAGRDNYYTMNELAEYTGMEVAIHIDGIQYTGGTSVDVLDYAPGWGTMLPREEELASHLISVVSIGVDLAKLVSIELVMRIGERLTRLLTIASIMLEAYGALRVASTNDVEVVKTSSVIRCVWKKAPLAEPMKDRGIVFRVNDAYASYSQPGVADGYVEIRVSSPNAGMSIEKQWVYPVRLRIMEAPR